MKNILRTVVFAFLTSCFGLFAEQTTPNPLVAPYADSLVVLKGDKLVPLKADRFLRTRFIVVYFGAGWCPDCRRFSPSLVAAYDQQTANAKRFEVLLVSRDKTQEAMLKFMKTEKMTWPALDFGKVTGAQQLQELYSGHGIPCLTVLDQQGKVVLQSKSDQDGTEILRELETLLKRAGSDSER